ncbi:hypothetical protein ES705_10636 [subsurface metagenome]
MEKEQEDIVWPTIMEVGGIIIGLAIMVGGLTQIYNRFHARNHGSIAIIIEKAEASKKKPKDS